MDNVTNLGTTQNTGVIFGIAYHTGYSLLSLIELLKTAPDMIQKIGVKNYSIGDLNGLVNELNKFVDAFEPVAEKKVS
jgi:hypothetical protein